MKLSAVELRWSDWDNGGEDPISRRFLDFVIDGKSLYEELRRVGNPGAGDRDPGITFLGWSGNSAWEQAEIERLLGEAGPEAWARQASIFVCPICGDINCGAITTKVEKRDNVITWSKFAFEHPDAASDVPFYYPIQGVGPFSFDTSHLRDIFLNRPNSDPEAI